MAEHNSLFILAQGVEFIPVAEVHEKTRSGFTYDEDDVVVTYTNTRNRSKIISADFAALLKGFERPKSFAGAIFSYCTANEKDPLLVADEVFTLLQSMEQQGFLEKQRDEKEKKPTSTLVAGDCFSDYTVIKKVYGYEDTEVYQVKDADENLFALKLLIAINNKHVLAMFENEVKALSKLDGEVNPVMKAHGKEGGIPFIVMEWCHALLCHEEAARYKNTNSRQHALKLLDICIAIAGAFHQLHLQGIIHGDIQQANILVLPKGQIKILDYGYAVAEGHSNTTVRGGTGFFYEPEYTASVINNEPAPALTVQAEQYSLAVLLYKLLTGHEYLDFYFEKEKLYRQIAETAPISIKKYDLLFPLSLDAVLLKALAKKPGERFDSMQAFADALKQCRNEILESSNFFIDGNEKKDAAFVDFLVEKFSAENVALNNGLQNAPTCSANFGAAGIAYFFYRLACIKKDNRYIELAEKWIGFALEYEKDYESSFYSPALGITEKSVGRHSLYHSEAGIYLVQAIIFNAKGLLDSFAKSVNDYLTAAEKKCDMADLALGRAGLLLGCALLHREAATVNGFDKGNIETVAGKLLQSIWDEIDGNGPMHQKNAINYFGIAHGWAGLLYATLLWCSQSNTALPENFIARVNELENCAVTKADCTYWPLAVADINKWPGWCNGNAGHIFLWLLLYKNFKQEKYLQLATRLANDLMATPKNSNSTICCGTAGIAYAMLAMHRATGSTVFYDEALQLKTAVLKNLFSPVLDNNSLYKGEVGLGLLLAEMENISLVKLPLFE